MSTPPEYFLDTAFAEQVPHVKMALQRQIEPTDHLMTASSW
jgi:hypothetical protein